MVVDRQTERQKDRQTDRKTDRQTDKVSYRGTSLLKNKGKEHAVYTYMTSIA